MPALRELDISGNANVTDGILDLLPESLERIRCVECPLLTDRFMVGLAKLPRLRELSLHREYTRRGDKTRFTASGMVRLLRTARLERLDLAGNHQLQGPGWSELWDALRVDRDLRFLGLAGLDSVRDAHCGILARHPKLERLQLSRTGITDAGVALLAEAGRRWRYLALGHVDTITEAALEKLAGQPLEEIHLYDTAMSTAAAARLIRKHWPNAEGTLPDGTRL